MTPLFDVGAIALAALGTIALAVSFVVRRIGRHGLAIGLDLWTAAGLLRLAAPDVGWARIEAAAALVVVRHIVTFGLGAARARR